MFKMNVYLLPTVEFGTRTPFCVHIAIPPRCCASKPPRRFAQQCTSLHRSRPMTAVMATRPRWIALPLCAFASVSDTQARDRGRRACHICTSACAAPAPPHFPTAIQARCGRPPYRSRAFSPDALIRLQSTCRRPTCFHSSPCRALYKLQQIVTAFGPLSLTLCF